MVGTRWARRVSLPGAAVVAVTACALVLAGPGVGPAAATITIPVPGGGFSMPTMVGGAAGTAIVTAEGVTTVVVGTPIVASILVAGTGLAIGYAVGSAGVNAVGFVHDNFFGEDHVEAPITAGQTFSFDYGGVHYDVAYRGVTCATASDCRANWNLSQDGYSGGGYGTGTRVVSRTDDGGTGYYSEIYHSGGGAYDFQAGSLNEDRMAHQTVWNLVDAAGTNLGEFGFTVDVEASWAYQLVTSGQCIGPDVETTTVREVSAPFHDGTDAPSDFPAVVCPDGSHLFGLLHTVEKIVPDLTPETVATGSSWQPSLQPGGSALTDRTSPYADCGANAATPCQVVYRDAAGNPVAPGRAPNPSTGVPTVPDHCTWGPHTLTAAQCGPEPKDPTDPAPDPDPPVVTHPQDPSGQDCWPSGWSAFNPLEWVLKPTLCALRSAFEPNPATMQAAYADAASGWNATGLPAWGSAVGGVGTSLAGFAGGTGGCAGPHFSFHLSGHDYDFDPFNACDAPMAGVALVVKLFASIAVCVVGARLCARPLLASFGMRQ